MRQNLFISATLTLAWYLCPSVVEAAFPQLKLEVVCENQITSPVAMVPAGDGSGRMFVVDQRGRIRIFRNGMLEPGNFLDLGPKLIPESQFSDERGLLGLAFHPGFGNPVSPGYRRFYAFYIASSPNAPGTTANPVNSRQVIAEFQVSTSNPDVADPASERILLSWDKPQSNHAGGGLAFGPDGYLYFSVGDGGNSNDNNAGHTGGSTSRPTNALGNAQDLTNLLGKIHRIDPLGTNGPGGQYGIPADNPFAASPNGERPEIYAYGLRNTWRFSFDSRPGGTNRLFAADVGQGQVEEIDIITKGGNYGWRNKEGTFIPSFSIDAPALATPAIDPIAQYAHLGVIKGSPALPQYGVSCTGGYVYRGSAIPELVGKYVFGDYSTSGQPGNGTMLGVEETSPGVWSLAFLDILSGNPIGRYIQGFGQDEDGELYVLTKQTKGPSEPDLASGLPSGRILKIVPVSTTPSHRKTWENQYYFIGEYINDTADTDNDGLANGIEYAWGFSPKSRNPLSDGLNVNYSGLAVGNPIIATFRRDPLATDVTYELQASSDMVTWTTLCQSVGGATPTGTGFVSESVISGQPPYRNVVVRDDTPAGLKRFIRLKAKR